MSKNKKMLLMLAKGGMSQSDIAAALHVSKRDVAACAKVAREQSLTFEVINSMDIGTVDDLFSSKGKSSRNEAYLQPDMTLNRSGRLRGDDSLRRRNLRIRPGKHVHETVQIEQLPFLFKNT